MTAIISTSAPTTSTNTFTCFPDLPTEVRLEIWKHVAADTSTHPKLSLITRSLWNQGPLPSFKTNPPPVLLQINQESRYETSKHYRIIRISQSSFGGMCLFVPNTTSTLIVESRPTEGSHWDLLCTCTNRKGYEYPCLCEPGTSCIGLRCANHMHAAVCREIAFLKTLSTSLRIRGIKHVVYVPAIREIWSEVDMEGALEKCFVDVELISFALSPRVPAASFEELCYCLTRLPVGWRKKGFVYFLQDSQEQGWRQVVYSDINEEYRFDFVDFREYRLGRSPVDGLVDSLLEDG